MIFYNNHYLLHLPHYSQFADHQLPGRGPEAVLLLDDRDLHLEADRGDGDYHFYADSPLFCLPLSNDKCVRCGVVGIGKFAHLYVFVVDIYKTKLKSNVSNKFLQPWKMTPSHSR